MCSYEFTYTHPEEGKTRGVATLNPSPTFPDADRYCVTLKGGLVYEVEREWFIRRRIDPPPF